VISEFGPIGQGPQIVPIHARAVEFYFYFYKNGKINEIRNIALTLLTIVVKEESEVMACFWHSHGANIQSTYLHDVVPSCHQKS
jgi:hypothetical protein